MLDAVRRARGIENVIALRGDPPRGEGVFSVAGGRVWPCDGPAKAHQRSTSSSGWRRRATRRAIRRLRTCSSDIEYVKQKVDEGAEFLITQLFYDNADFYRFRDLARASGDGGADCGGGAADTERAADTSVHGVVRGVDSPGDR